VINVIQVGTGRWGGNWAHEILPTVRSIEVSAYVDSNPAALEALRAKTGVAQERCFASLEGALDAVPCDIVLGTLRTEAHFAVIQQALEAGRHAIVEKPFAATLHEAAALVRLAQQKQRLLMVSQNYRFYRAPRRVAAMLKAGTIGSVDQVAIDFRRHGPSMGYAYYDFPDPLVADMAIHHFDLMRMVLGCEPVRVSCRTWNPVGSPFQHHPSGVVTAEFANGAVVTYRGSWMSAGPDTPWSGEWVMNGTKGELNWACRGDAGQDRSKVDWLRHRTLRGAAAEVPLDDLPYYDRAGTIAALAESVRTGTVPKHFPTGADNIFSLALVKACTLSASHDGDWVKLSDLISANGTPA
jgi:predicted dehydrogenase